MCSSLIRLTAHAIARNGIVEAAVVFLPLRGKLYAAARGHGATLNGQPISASQTLGLDGATVLASRPNFRPDHWRDAEVPPVKRQFRSSLAYRLSLVGEGRFDAMMTLHPTWEWDVAAGSLIVEEAGGTVSDQTRAHARFNNPTPKLSGLVAAGPKLHTELLGRLA